MAATSTLKKHSIRLPSEAASELLANAQGNTEPQLKLVRSKGRGRRGVVVAASRAPAGTSPDGELRRFATRL